MMIRSWPSLFVFLGPWASAPAPQASAPNAAAPTPQEQVVRNLLHDGLASGQAYDKLTALVAVAPHRLSGSPGAAAAVEWARRAMQADGLENVHLEPCLVPHWERGQVQSLRFATPGELSGQKLTILSLGGSDPTPVGGLRANVLEVADLDGVRALGERARGAIVFINKRWPSGLPDTGQGYGLTVDVRGSGAIEAGRLGARAVVIRSVSSRLDDFPHTGAMRYEDGVPRIPAAALSTLAADRLSAALAREPGLELHLELDCRWFEDAPSFNVVGEIVGRELPEQIVLVGGHLDCWDVGQGAHDDGSGSVQSIEALRLIKNLGLRPRRTLRCVLFMNEENGLRGGLAYRDAHKQELEQHVFALESDSGGMLPRGFGGTAPDELLELMRGWVEPLEEAGCGKVHQGGGGADIGPLGEFGVPLASLRTDGQRYFDLHHSERDTIDNVWPRELNLGAAAMAAMLYGVAEHPDALPRNPPKAPASK